MTKLYSFPLFILFFMLLFYTEPLQAQCVSGQPAGTTAYDTTIRFPTGATNMQVKFPKFDPQTAMLSCVKLIVTVIGVVDSVALQNFSSTSQTANVYYNRSDLMTGPGLTSALSNNFNGNYGPYTLAAYDGLPNSGPDFHSAPKDTVLKNTMVRTLTDSTEISQFYGHDSVIYNYNINVTTSASITGGSSSSLVLTSALVNFRFEYCTCPLAVLPIGLKNFGVTRSGSNTATLHWEAEAGNDHYYYEVETSRDGRHFSKAGSMNKILEVTNPSYNFPYHMKAAEYGRYYFRVKQIWYDGYYRYSDVRSLDYSNPLSASVSVYPNPSSGQVGVKFVAAKAGWYQVQVSNAGGQVIINKKLQTATTDYKALAVLQKGMYYVKVTEAETQETYIHQLIIQ